MQNGENMAKKKSKIYPKEPQNSSQNKAEEPYIAWDLTKAVSMVSSGLPTEILKTIQVRLGLSNIELSELLMVSPRTLDRRKKEDTLPADESERSYRIARLTELASEVTGSGEKASEWFKKPNFALGNKTPLELMQTEPGARLVERTLNQIKHGITV